MNSFEDGGSASRDEYPDLPVRTRRPTG